jgi:YD repeat-containing protein
LAGRSLDAESSSARGDGTPGSAPQSVTVNTSYLGATGLATAVTRLGNDSPLGILRDSTEYDALGRVTRRFAQGAILPESLQYDPAGNVVRRVTPRGGVTTSSYDALNRPTTVITSAMPYTSMRVGTATYTNVDPALTPAFPRAPLGRSGNPLVVDGDTATFTYDWATGQLATANNRAAQVSRTYLATGWLTSETQRVRTVSGDDFSQHVYTTQYAYDVAGRRTTVTHPTQLAPGTHTETWTYDPLTGRPAAVRDPLDSAVTFHFDPAGQLVRQMSPNNVSRQYHYTLDGEVALDLLAPGNATI